MALAGPNDIPPDFMQTFDLEEIPDPEAHPMTTDAINYDDPAAVTAALMKEFPPEALFSDDKGFQYVQYQQVLRRLIRATGNRFDIEVLDHRITPHGSTTKGVEKFLCIATVRLTIPVLQSSRTQIGVQVAMANTEDLFKGGVSDGIKKAAQAFGVAIELAGDDRELAATHALYAPEPSGHTQQVSSPSQQVSRAPAASQAPQDARQAPPAQRNGTPTIQNPAALATEKQVGYLKSLAQRAKYSDEDLDGLIFDQTNGQETIDTLTKGGASACIEWLKAQLS